MSFYEPWITDAIKLMRPQFHLMEFLKHVVLVLCKFELSPSADGARACRAKTASARYRACPASTRRGSRTCGSGRLCSRRCWTRSFSTWWRTAGTFREGSMSVCETVCVTGTKCPFSHLSSSKYYEKEAVLMDPVDGPILASLLGNYTWLCEHLSLLLTM